MLTANGNVTKNAYVCITYTKKGNGTKADWVEVCFPYSGSAELLQEKRKAKNTRKETTMNEESLYKMIREKEGTVSLMFPALMRKVYVWMTLALIITGFTAWGVASNPGLVYAIVTNKILFWGLVIAELAMVWAISGAINRLSLTTATLLFVGYSVLNGVTLSVVFLAYTLSSIASVFFITAGTFAAMAFIGYTTKTDLTSLGKILFMALIGLIIATVVNLFMGSSMFNLILSYVGVAIFVGLTAYDSQKIKNMLYEADELDESSQKLALLGSLTLYLDFINLFLYLLRIFGSNRD